MAAVVLGTALSAFGADRATAAQAPGQAVHDIGRYCTSCWRNAHLPADSWGDCTQEVYKRLLERVPSERWGLALHAEGDERREFLRAIDAVKNAPSALADTVAVSMAHPTRAPPASRDSRKTARRCGGQPSSYSARDSSASCS